MHKHYINCTSLVKNPSLACTTEWFIHNPHSMARTQTACESITSSATEGKNVTFRFATTRRTQLHETQPATGRARTPSSYPTVPVYRLQTPTFKVDLSHWTLLKAQSIWYFHSSLEAQTVDFNVWTTTCTPQSEDSCPLSIIDAL